MQTSNKSIQNAKLIGKTAPMFNHYMEFGNSLMGRYSGMSAMINPISLLYLQSEEKEEERLHPSNVTYIQNRIYKVTHHEYNTVANRYLINYHNTSQVIRENPIYAANPNFRPLIGSTENHDIRNNTQIINRQDIHPVSLVHSGTENSQTEETDDAGKTLTTERIRELIRTVVKEAAVTEKTVENASEKVIEKTRQSILEVLKSVPQAETRLYSVLERELRTVITDREKYTEKEIRTEISRVVENAVEQAVKRLPDETRKILSAKQGQNLRNSQNNILTESENDKLTNTIIRQLQTISRITENVTVQSSAVMNNMFRNNVIQNNIVNSVFERQKRGKELFQTQIMERLNPLPVRPVTLVFPKESDAESREAIADRSETKEIIDKEIMPAILQKTNVVVKKENQAEHKYYTHIMERFLKSQDSEKSEEPDRRSMPAGIIWHNRPKETVRFERKDVVQIPVELIYEKEPQTGMSEVVTQQTIKNVEQSVIKNILRDRELAVSEKHVPENLLVEKQITEKRNAETDILEYGLERRVVRNMLPVFTKQENREIISLLTDFGMEAAGNVTYDWKGNTLELIIPNAAANEGQTEMLNNVISKSVSPQIIQTIQKTAAMAPVSLIYKAEAAPEEKTEAEKKEEITEFLDDIVFEKKTVSGSRKQNDITINESGNDMVEIPGVTVTGQAGGNSRTVVSRSEVDSIISEKVSRHVDENISRISRQVYKDIERQLKKERDRRGM